MKAESRQIPQKLAARLEFFTVSDYSGSSGFSCLVVAVTKIVLI